MMTVVEGMLALNPLIIPIESLLSENTVHDSVVKVVVASAVEVVEEEVAEDQKHLASALL